MWREGGRKREEMRMEEVGEEGGEGQRGDEGG
jgi:hypothetical protein